MYRIFMGPVSITSRCCMSFDENILSVSIYIIHSKFIVITHQKSQHICNNYSFAMHWSVVCSDYRLNSLPLSHQTVQKHWISSSGVKLGTMIWSSESGRLVSCFVDPLLHCCCALLALLWLCNANSQCQSEWNNSWCITATDADSCCGTHIQSTVHT